MKICKEKILEIFWIIIWNRDFAQEYTPEVFGSVTMLYVDAKINGFPIQVLFVVEKSNKLF